MCLLSYFQVVLLSSYLFFFKQKTAYEVRISDWSSDVCSSDLDEQKLIRQAAVASRDFERKDSRADSKKAMDTLKEHGMKINVVSDEEIARMRQKVQPVVDKYTQELGDRKSTRLNSSH